MLFPITLIVTAVAAYFFPIPSDAVERYYSSGFYSRLQPIVTGITNRVPFALFDVLLVGTATILVVAVAQVLATAWRNRSVRPLLRFLGNLATATGAVYLVFLVTWGLNYRREPLSSRLAHDSTAIDVARLARLAHDAATQLNALHDRAHREGFASWEQLRPTLEPAYHALHSRLSGGPQPRPGAPKWSILTYFFERAGVSGMTDPFLLEVLVDRSLLPFERPFVLAHEWAHLAGRADEAEANFLGWLTCVRSGAPAAYSGWLYLYSDALSALPRPERAAVLRALGPGPRADLTAVAERARRIQPALQSASWRVYDRYLKANRVEAGVASYDKVLQLILGTKFESGWAPVVRRPGY